ncbi:MAG: S41 family peptidase [Bacteroidota bacterium]
MKKLFFSLLAVFFLFTEVKAQLDEAVNKPVETFDALWELFYNKYASFEEKNIDWDSIGQVYRPKVNPNTSNAELFHIFCEMLRPLNDAHVNLIVSKADTTFDAERASRLVEDLKPIRGNIRASFDEMVKTTLQQNGIKEIKTLGKEFYGFPLFWYGDNGKLGYLRVGRCFSSILIKNGWSSNKKLNTIFKSFADLDAIVIDIRLNPGGTDGFSKKVVGRLTDRKVIGYHKQTRANREFGPLNTHYIKPKGKHKFLKPVYLLTNDKSISAADVMALMMAELDNVTIIGENSNGSYSDIYSKKLPNKWTINLSNQRYLTTDNENYEGIGTPVNVEVKNKLENYVNKDDKVLNKAFELIRKK